MLSRVVLVLALVMTASGSSVSADPGDGVTIKESVTSNGGTLMATYRTKLPPGKGAITPLDTSQTTIAGGVTAYGTAGLQWRVGFPFHDVQGVTISSTSSSISEMETHGVLLKGPWGNSCYEVEITWIQNSLVVYNQPLVSSGWGPWKTGTNWTQCWRMETGHYFINLGSRTDMYGPGALKNL
jgi:hypothetical protein